MTENVAKYVELRKKYSMLRLNFWTTVGCLNVGDLENIIEYSETVGIEHAYGFCIQPSPLDIRYINKLTIAAKQQLLSTSNKLYFLFFNR